MGLVQRPQWGSARNVRAGCVLAPHAPLRGGMQGKTHGLKDRVISAGLPATLIVTETCMAEEEGAPADGTGSAESGGRGAKNTARGKMCMASLAKKS